MVDDSCSIFRNVCGMTFGRLAKWWLINDSSSMTHQWLMMIFRMTFRKVRARRPSEVRCQRFSGEWQLFTHLVTTAHENFFSWNRVELITRIIFASRTKVWIATVAEIYAIKVGEWTLLTKIFFEFSNYSNDIHLISTRWSFLSLAPKRESLPLLRYRGVSEHCSQNFFFSNF